MKSRVFVVNETVRRNRATGSFERNRDFSSAASFGSLLHLTPPGTPPGDLSAQVAGMSRMLSDFGPDDYIIPVGHPALIGWACAVAARNAGGRLRLLIWHEQSASYFPAEATLWTTGKEPEKIA